MYSLASEVGNREKMKLMIIILLFRAVLSNEYFSNAHSISTKCIYLCKNNEVPRLYYDNANVMQREQLICQRGCRLFNIINFKDELNLNTTEKECHLSCEESYMSPRENGVCKIGCNLMLKKRQMEMSSFLIFTEDGSSNAIVLAEPEIEALEPDTLSDPSIRSQLEIGFNIDYKIPETRIRTMPIETQGTAIILKPNYSGDWLDCASRNSGIPRWILLTAILSAVLLALWLSFSTEKRSSSEEPLIDVDIPDQKMLLEQAFLNTVEKDPNILPHSEVNFSSPPKYLLVNEHV